MVINVSRNYLKLLGQQFMHLVPVVANMRLEMGMKIPVKSEQYGDMGVVQVEGFYECHLYELKDAAMCLADGNKMSKEALIKTGFHNLTKIQCARFSFVRRSDEAFKRMMDTELLRAGLEITRQAALF